MKEKIKVLARISLGLFMLGAGVGHLSFQRVEFQAQVPGWLPLAADTVVLVSGVLEILLGLGILLAVKYRRHFGLLLALFYVLIFPGNIAQYINGTSAFHLTTDTARLLRLFFQPVLILWALWSTGASQLLRDIISGKKRSSIYDIAIRERNGNEILMSEFKGQYLLIVNTATKCGLANQFEGLEKLHRQYGSKGLTVLGFPCNQFASQEPETDESVAATCALNFGVSFPLMGKIDVNGKHTAPLFRWLKAELPGALTDDIKWNFTKFLIDKNGKPVKRFSPTTKPATIETVIQNLL